MDPQEVARGAEVGKWKLQRELGSGGQGTVWQVTHLTERHSPPGALKLCSRVDEKAKARFKREIELLGRQNHPGIVRVRDSGEHQGRPFLVMERASTTLAAVSTATSAGTRLVGEGRELLLRFLRQACDAVAHLHREKVLHRDIKPSNILLMLEPPEPLRAVVADLGIATGPSDAAKLTATHEVIGSATFRAPESLNGKHTTRSDVYSLGKTIEAVLNGGVPVEIGPARLRRDQRLTERLWDALDKLLERACAFDPGLRYEDADALMQELPEVALDLAWGIGGYSPIRQLTTIALSITERSTLFNIIAACPASDETASLAHIQHRSRVSDYDFAMAVRRLENVDFVATTMVDGDFNSRYPEVRPTDAAIQWAHEHQDEMEAALAELARRAAAAEIPF